MLDPPTIAGLPSARPTRFPAGAARQRANGEPGELADARKQLLRYHPSGMGFSPELEIPKVARDGWERGPTLSRHNLAESPLFSDGAIIDLLDRTPKENLFALHMGDDPERHDENRLAVHDGLSGEALLH